MKELPHSVGQAKPAFSDVKQLRLTRKENQTDFWQRFGVTQSRGSRFEQGGDMPMSVVVLIELYLQKKVSDHDLQNILRNIARNGQGRCSTKRGMLPGTQKKSRDEAQLR
jgi:hypothetical protein